MTVKGCTQYIR